MNANPASQDTTKDNAASLPKQAKGSRKAVAPSAQSVGCGRTENGNRPQYTAAITIDGPETIARNSASAQRSQKDPL